MDHLLRRVGFTPPSQKHKRNKYCKEVSNEYFPQFLGNLPTLSASNVSIYNSKNIQIQRQLFSFMYLTAAFTSPRCSGVGFMGSDLNSGWNCEATKNG